jgi:acetyl esterase/lipase
MKIMLVMLFSLLTSACTDVAFYLANFGVEYENMHIERDVIYDVAHQLTLDVYAPASTPPKATIMFVYGGGWQAGDKKDYGFIAERFVKLGYTVIIPNYRLYPNVTYPAFVQDTAYALQWVDANYHEPLFIMGHSAGAYNAVMVAVNDAYAPNVMLRGVIGIAGPYNFTPTDETYQGIFNHQRDYKNIHVSKYVTDHVPPMLLLHGSDDSTVDVGNTISLAARLRRFNNSVQVRYYEDMGHYKIIAALNSNLADRYEVERDILNFIEARLRDPAM